MACFCHVWGIILAVCIIVNPAIKNYSYYYLDTDYFFGIFYLFILSQAKWQIVNVKPDITNRYYHYQAIRGTFAKYYEQEMDHNIRIVSRRYQIPSMVNFYIKPKLEAYCIVLPGYHESTYSFVHNDEDYLGKDFYYLKLGEREKDERFWKLFESYQYIKLLTTLEMEKKLASLFYIIVKTIEGKKTLLKIRGVL